MICQSYVPALEQAFKALDRAGLLDKQVFCYVLDRALYATRCGTKEPFRPNNKKSPRYIEAFCRSRAAEKRRTLADRIRQISKGPRGPRKEKCKRVLEKIVVTKEHVIPGAVLWNLFDHGTVKPASRAKKNQEKSRENGTPVSVIAALYNVAFVTLKQNKCLSESGLKSSMPNDWSPPRTLDEVSADKVWDRYRKAGLFDEMIRVANYDGD